MPFCFSQASVRVAAASWKAGEARDIGGVVNIHRNARQWQNMRRDASRARRGKMGKVAIFTKA